MSRDGSTQKRRAHRGVDMMAALRAGRPDPTSPPSSPLLFTRAFSGELLGPMFVEVARMDLTAHLPMMWHFWEAVPFRVGPHQGTALRGQRDRHARNYAHPRTLRQVARPVGSASHERPAGARRPQRACDRVISGKWRSSL